MERSVVRRLSPQFLRRMLRRVRDATFGPSISVIVPMYNVERYVTDCLASILGQDVASMEVIVVDDGSTDRSADIVRAIARRDRRVKLISQPNAGQGPARNRAIRRARGEFLVFVDSDDAVPRRSFRYLVARLRQSGSDFTVAGVRRLRGDESYRPSWTVVVHERDRIGITIDDFPAAMADVVAHHRIFRRKFWTQRIGDFAPGVYEDHVPMVAAYLRGRFDLLSRVTYEWRLRDEGTSTGQQKHDLANLEQRIRVKAKARELVWREGAPPVRAAWVGRVLNIDFPPYVEQALRADDGYRRTLQQALTTYVDLASAEALTYVRVRQKLRTYLGARGRWDALRGVEEVFEELGSIPPTTVRGGKVLLLRSLFERIQAEIPDELLALSRSECRLQVCLTGCESVGPRTVRLSGWAVIRAVDLSDRDPSIRLTLIDEGESHAVQLAVERVDRPEATAWVNWPHGSFRRAGFSADLDLEQLVGDEGLAQRWRLHARVQLDGLARENGVYHALEGSSATRAALAGRRIQIGRMIARPVFDREHGFSISMEVADARRNWPA